MTKQAKISYAIDILEKDVITEKNTDALIDILVGSLPLPWWVPKRVIKRVLDKLLPETLIKALRDLAANI